jgi:4-hydroxy-tetrahydrodipicolinate reductase
MMRAVIWGFGRLGRAIARTAAASGSCEIVGIVDSDPAIVGRPLAEFLPGAPKGRVERELAGCASADASLLFHATTSAREATTRQALAALEAGYSVVSGAEWLFHPWLRHPVETETLDRAARAASRHVIGCGINPGFSFDTLPLILSRTAHSFSSIRIRRVADVSGEGPSGFHHLGFGLGLPAFAERVAAGTIEGHMGFPESIAALAERLALPLDRITDFLEPTPAERPLQLTHRLISPGEVVGITQTATGYAGERAVVTMRLEMFLDPTGYGRSPQESVEIDGSRSFAVSLKPAAPPADGAATMMIYAATALATVAPGLISLFDLPIGGAPPDRRLRERDTKRTGQGTSIGTAGLTPPSSG